jgi:WS/DGAT/MGAT family acyltransferase
MTPARPLERLTASDLFLLLWEDYGWSTDIGGMAILDGADLLDGEGSVLIDQVRRHLEPRLSSVPRFRQVLRRPRLGLGWPLWVDATRFDIAEHVQVRPLSEPADEDDLLRAAQDLAGRPLVPSRPLWELWLLPGLPGRRVGAFLRMHHVIGDGASAMAAFGALLDLTADPPTPVTRSWAPSPAPTPAQLVRDNVVRRRRELGRALAGLAHPRATVRMARQVLPAWREVLTEAPAPATSLNVPVSPDRRFAVIRADLATTRQVARTHDAKVNDVLLTVVAAGLRELLHSRGEEVQALDQRAMVTITSPPGERAGGNKPGWMMVPLPLGEPDNVRRLEAITIQTAARKRLARPEAGSGVFRFVAGQRAWYRRFARQRSVNLVVSNVPGPPTPLYLAGARVLEMFPSMPTMGNLTLVVAALSYAGQLNITAVADARHCADVEVFAQGVRTALDDLTHTLARAAS